MWKKIALLAGVSLATACSPSLTYFTQPLYEEHRWTEAELKKIQFYLSDDLVLRRAAPDANTEISAGSIRIINGERVEEVVIPRATPGVMVFSPKANRLAISFEEGSDQRFLMFGPNPKAGNRYVVLAKDWNRYDGQVSYDGKEYTVEASNALSSLMVDLRKVEKVEINSRTAQGRKL